jgi:cysteine desulfurase
MSSERPIYLDCAATTPPDPRVLELMHHYLAVEFGNQGSRTHDYGARARTAVEHARDQVASVVAARRGEVIFTSGATEANNLAIFGVTLSAGPKHIVTTAIEHPSVMEPITELEARGFQVTRIAPTSGGWVDAREVLSAVRPDTALVSVMHVNNETGVIQPVSEIAEGLHKSEIRLHVDAAQGFGKIVETLRHPRIDLISVSAHKIGGPQGVGALIARRRGGLRLQPIMFGGGQEGGLRPGTLPAHLIAGFGLAAELAIHEADERLRRATEFRSHVLKQLTPTNYEANGDATRTSPYILNLSFPGLDNEQVIDAWSDFVAVSNGAACASQRTYCSHVLNAMGIGGQRAAGAVRLSWYQSPETLNLRALVDALKSIPVGRDERIA